MTESSYEHQTITQTIITESIFSGLSIGTFQEDFQLCEADFLRLKSGENPLINWALNVFFATFGYGLSILPKWISEISGRPEKVSSSEWIVLIIGIIGSLILYGIGKCITNEKKEILNRISLHFKSAPKTRQFVQGKK